MGAHRVRRATMLAALVAVAAFPLGSSAAATKRYRCRARLEREPDHKETRTVEVVCDDGKTVSGIDGEREYKTSPPTVMGLSCDFTAQTDGDGIAVKLHAVYRTTQVTIVAGLIVVTSTTDVIALLRPGDVSTSTMDVNGTPYTLTVSAKAVE